jgi:hypothetical protein
MDGLDADQTGFKMWLLLLSRVAGPRWKSSLCPMTALVQDWIEIYVERVVGDRRRDHGKIGQL